jgi:two-component system LytT family response regulator
VGAEERAGKIRVVIVDDEPLARSNLTSLLRRDSEVEIVGECGSGMEVLTKIRNLRPDLVFGRGDAGMRWV